MRAVTVRQPWAWAIVHGGKDVENRTRNIAGAYRGPVAIHAGLSTSVSTVPGVLEVADAWRAWWGDAQAAGIDHGQQRGAVIGVVDLVDLCRSTWEQMDAEQMSCCLSSWAQSPPEDGVIHHLHLNNPRPLTRPIPATGRLGLWTVPADIEAAIREQVDL